MLTEANETPERKWLSLEHSGQFETDWWERFHDPRISLEEALGLVHVALSRSRPFSLRIAQLLLALARPTNRYQEAAAETLANKARHVLVRYFLGRTAGSQWKHVAADYPQLFKMALAFFGETYSQLDRHEQNGVQTLTDECRDCWWHDGVDSVFGQRLFAALGLAMDELVTLAHLAKTASWLAPAGKSDHRLPWQERITLVLDAQLKLVQRELATNDVSLIALSDKECAQQLVLYFVQRRAHILQQIQALQQKIAECRKAEEIARDNWLKHFSERESGNYKREAHGWESRAQQARETVSSLEKELVGLPQF